MNLLLILFCITTRVLSSEICGRSYGPVSSKISKRIVGGEPASPGNWPWQVSIKSNRYHHCGGALLNSQWVITAGHCLIGKESSRLSVSTGIHRIMNDARDNNRKVSRIEIHHLYDDNELENDIALIKLETPVKFTKYIQPICLPDHGDELNPGTMTYITGFGATNSGLYESGTLMQAQVPVIDWKVCEKMVKEVTTDILFNNTICTIQKSGGVNPCFHDSGGPLVVYKNSKWIQYGVISWGPIRCADPSQPAVYTKVSDFLSWIENTISE